MRLTSLLLVGILALAGPIGNAFAQKGAAGGPSTGGRGSTSGGSGGASSSGKGGQSACRDAIGNAGIGASRGSAVGHAGAAASGGVTGHGSPDCKEALMQGAKSCAPTVGGLVALGLASRGKGNISAVITLPTNSAVLNFDDCLRDAREAYNVCVGSDRDRGTGPSGRDSGGGLISGDR